MVQEIVAVVDDCIVIADTVVGIGGRNDAGSNGLEIGRGLGRGFHEVGTQLAQQHSAVCNLLHLVQDAHDAVDGVLGGIEFVVFGKLHKV